MKRFLSWLLAAVLIVSVFPMPTQAAPSPKLIALTYDDGPSDDYTMELLDGLRKRGAKVTFFTMGKWAEELPHIVKQAYEDGHEIGSHSWDHPDLRTLEEAEIESQFTRSFGVLGEICGEDTDFLVRAPFGRSNPWVRSVVDRPFIDWGADSRDWEVNNADMVRENILNISYDGVIIVCHDLYGNTVTGTLQAIDILMDRGYEFVTVSELYRRRGVELKNGDLHFDCTPTGIDLGPAPEPTIVCISGADGVQIALEAPGNVPIYYTTDGSAPIHNVQKYEGPFLVDYGTEIQAVSAYKMNGGRSGVTVLDPEQYPDIAPQILVQDGVLTIGSGAPGTKLYYSLGSHTADTLYTGPVKIAPNTLVRAVAQKDDSSFSDEAVSYYTSYKTFPVTRTMVG